MFIAVKRRTLLLMGLAFLFSMCAALCLASSERTLPAFAKAAPETRTFVIDAGHGGEDGGALSAAGRKESDANLEISLKLDALLQFLGQNTDMTRREDVSIHSDAAQTLRQKKASDLKNRVAFVNETPSAVLVSIHQNSLPSVPSVHGAQVFYGKEEQGAALAASVQAALNEWINPENAKHEKPIDSTIYLMKNVNCPAILIECGFMSNPVESEALYDATYQSKVTVAIAAGILRAEREGIAA